jgi:hypothetical protein
MESGKAPLVHAGAVFDSLHGFILAVKEDQESFHNEAVLHKKGFNKTSGA